MWRRDFISAVGAWLIARARNTMPETGLRGPFLINPLFPAEDWDSLWSSMRGPKPGPFSYGTALYWVLIDYRSFYPPRILKSTDDGATWSVLLSFGAGATPEEWSYWVVRAGDTAHLQIVQFGNDSGRYQQVWDFDIGAETISLLGTSAALTSGELTLWTHYNHVTGEDYIFTRYTTPTPDSIRLWRHSGGSWQTPQDVMSDPITPTSWGVRAATDSDGVTHVFVLHQTSTAGTINYLQIAADGTVGSPTEIYDRVTGTPSGLDVWRVNQPLIIKDSLVLPFDYSGGFLIGDSLSSPSFTYYLPSGVGVTDCVASTNNAYGLPGTDGRLWWIDFPGALWGGRIISCTFDGTTKGDPEVVHDEDAYESFPGTVQYQYWLTPPTQLTSGKWGMASVLYDDVNWDTHYYWEWTKELVGASYLAMP